MTSLKEIKELISNSERPMAFYDDDPDGLCSYLMIKRVYPQLKGVCIRAPPRLAWEDYGHKVKKYCPDLIIVLDKPHVDEEFRENANVPIIWIDHHPVSDHKGTKYFNKNLTQKKGIVKPTAYWIYKMLQNKEDIWLAALGTISDYHTFTLKDFTKSYSHLLPPGKQDINKILFDSKFGDLIKIFTFNLKGKTHEVNDSIKALEKIKEPEEILNSSTPEGQYVSERASKISKAYEELKTSALSKKPEINKPFIFIYPSSKHSLSGMLSNELLSKIPHEFIVIGRDKGDWVIFSIRSKKKNLQPLIKKALKGINGYGGGHPNACGAKIEKIFSSIFLQNLTEAMKSS